MFEATLSQIDQQLILPLFGANDQHLRKITETLGVDITHRNEEIRVAGGETAVSQATDVLETLKAMVERKGELSPDNVTQILANVTGQKSLASQPPIDIFDATRQIRPRTPGQKRYVEAIRDHDLVFSIGPAGCGKTYLAVAMAIESLKQQSIRKIALVRPAVEAGESLGFLPGDLQAKINPFLRPLLDALHEMIDFNQVKRYMEMDVIEVVPLAYMRGRTLNDAFIILDEAQNATVSQMKMFLTRMGTNSKIVVSGDVTQVDLPDYSRSGLLDATSRLKNIKGVATIKLSNSDIVRHRLVQEIVAAYDEGAGKRR